VGRPESRSRPLVEEDARKIGGFQKSGFTSKRFTVYVGQSCKTGGHVLKITVVAVRTRQGPMYLYPKCQRPSVKLYLPPGCARDAASGATIWPTAHNTKRTGYASNGRLALILLC
jgi:hypothetical protein